MDPDGGVSVEEWQWARSSSRSGGFTDIPSASEATYTPGEDDTGKYLRATVTYTDAQGGGKSAYKVSNNRTQWKESGPPVFQDADGNPIDEIPGIERAVKENAAPGTNVGAPVAATDIGDRGIPETLTYTLSGTSAEPSDFNLFEIDSRTGQIKVKRGTQLDYEDVANRTYAVKVTAKDPSYTETSMSRDSIDVTITVTNVDEPPELDLADTTPVTPETAEGDLESGYIFLEPIDDTTTADELTITFVADDPETGTTNDNAALLWTLAGTDADDFVIGDNPATDATEADGVLTFKNGPDFEAPTDSGRNNVYEVTVQVADAAGNRASQKVKVTVENADEPGVVTLSHPQPEVGVGLMSQH